MMRTQTIMSCLLLSLLFLQCANGETTASHAYTEAISPREWIFPRDHGQHPDFQTEWWYFTGNLAEPDGKEFGYQFTVFRRALRPSLTGRTSAWATRDIYLAHAAITDVSEGKFQFAEQARRPALGLAGASTSTLNVWVENWRAERTGDGALKVSASTPDFSYDLDMKELKPPTLNGPGGRDSKGNEPQQASYYYSMTRLETSGTLNLGARQYKVSGLSWMDHEFGSNQMGAEQAGWDWFSLQLSDGSELMLYQLRQIDGTVDPNSGGTWVGADGKSRWLNREEIELTPGRKWKSPESGAEYPIEWKVVVPSLQIQADVVARIPKQEMSTGESTGITYWEGTVSVNGSRQGTSFSGLGYLEMTGYREAMASRI